MQLKKYVYGLSAGVLLIGVLIFTCFLSFAADEKLAANTAGVFDIGPLAQPDQIERHPYFIFLALNAAFDQDANQMGRVLYRCYWERWQHPDFIETFLRGEQESDCLQAYSRQQNTFAWTDEEESLMQLLRREDFHRIHASFVLEHKVKIEEMVQRSAVLLERVSAMNRMYAQSSSLPFVAIVAEKNYKLLADLHFLRLYHLWLKRDVKQLQLEREQLLQVYQHQQDTILKTMYWALNIESIDLLHDLDGSDTAPLLAELSQDALSLEGWLLNDRYIFYRQADQLQEVSNRNRYLGEILEAKGMPWQYAVIRSMTSWNEFRLNMTLNRYADYFQQMQRLSELPELEFRKQLGSFSLEVGDVPLIVEKNYFGVMLINFSIPVAERWVVLPRLLNQKIKLFNVLHAGKPVDLEHLNQNKEGDIYYLQNGLLCMKHYLNQNARVNLIRYAAQDVCLLML